MVTYMKDKAANCKSLAQNKWSGVIQNLERQLEHWTAKKEIEESQAPDLMTNALSKWLGKFNFYCQQVPVLRFNSARYDLNLIKKHIAKYICLHKSQGVIIKKNNTYTCLSNDLLRFLDITNFQAPGASYSQFLKKIRDTGSKGFFPL